MIENNLRKFCLWKNI